MTQEESDLNMVKPPQTIGDFKEMKESILSLMGNPYCDHGMFMSLSEKLDRVNAKIEEFHNQQNK